MHHIQKDKKVLALFVLFVLLFALLWSFGSTASYSARLGEESTDKDEKSHALVRIGDAVFRAEVVHTLAARRRGLSGRDTLPEDAGMLFVFGGPSDAGIWMKDMRFPIDIIWIGEDREIIAVKKDASPDSYPLVFSPPQDASYVLEVNAGVADTFGLAVGDKVHFDILSTSE